MNAWMLLLAALQPVSPELLRELEDASAHFADAAASYDDDVHSRVVQKYNVRKFSISRAYEDHIRDLEVEERSKRVNAIATFEAFLQKHPHDPTYSPDALFRLAELYFERSNDDYYAAVAAYEKQPATAPEPRQNYKDAVGLYKQLIAEFPQYRLLDGAYYLLGYCLGEQGDEVPANETYLTLVDRFPGSKFAVEAWTRIGEHYFDRNALELAVGAYTHVLEHPESGLYDKALYKLGWSFYRLDRCDDAVARFAELVDYADEKTAKGGGELRTEAIQYLGICFGDESWGGLQKAAAYFEAHPKRWSNEVFAMLGGVYFDQAKYTEAIDAYEAGLRVAPRNRDAPKLRDKVITAFERMRDFDGAAAAREALAIDFADGSDWSAHNAADADALITARELSERSVLAAAVFRHRQAQGLKEQGKADEAKREYAAAAGSYDRYLRRFPGARNRYELMYFLADSQFYADQLGDAARNYGLVAEDESSDKYLEVAAYSAVIAAERRVQQMETAGLMSARPVLSSAQRTAPPHESELTPARSGLVAAADRYVERVPVNEKTPSLAFKAAEQFYVHDRFAEARARFTRIIEAYPKHQVARFATNLMIESYMAEKAWDEVARFCDKIQKEKKIGAGDAAFADELAKFKLGAMFKKAEALDEAEEHDTAAAQYLSVVNANKHSQYADKALNNAAVNFEKTRRFESATNLYARLSADYPDSPLADNALFRIGYNSERFYDFDRAIKAYANLVDGYPNSQKRPDALYNAAVALENTQQYERAITEYKRYATLFPDRPDAAAVFFRAGRAAEAMGDSARAIATYGEFIARYKNKAKASHDKVVEAYVRIGVLNRAHPSAAKAAFINAVKEASARRAGMMAAAEAQFRIGELAYSDYESVPIEGSSKSQKQAIVKRATLLTKAREAYQAVFPFKQIEWTLAALYRMGHLYETFADALFTAPPPPEIKKLGQDYIEEYRVLIEEQAVPLEDKAVDAYKRTLAEAKKAGVANSWTKRTQKSLNKLRKNEFPLQKEARQSPVIWGFATETPVQPASAPVAP